MFCSEKEEKKTHECINKNYFESKCELLLIFD